MTPHAPKITLPPKQNILKNMEAMIHHFVLITKGPMNAPEGELYSAIEAPKGELTQRGGWV